MILVRGRPEANKIHQEGRQNASFFFKFYLPNYFSIVYNSSPQKRTFGANVRTVGQESSTTSGNENKNVNNGGWGAGNRTSGGAGSGGGRAGGPPPQNPLDQLAVLLGIHGKTVNAPALMGVPETPIPLIYIGLIVLIGVVLKNYLIPLAALVGFYGYQYSKLQ